ncbi:MAG: hypothetical protein AAGB93_06985 [Planctomycetota bacterium]
MSDAARTPSPGRRRLAILAVSTAFALIGLELFIDRFVPILGQIYMLDGELLHDAQPSARRLQPMHRGWLREGDVPRVLVEIGPDGFRGPALERPKTRPRLLVIGDSFVMAENVPHDRTFVVQLGKAVDAARDSEGARGPSIEAVNAGRAGYGSGQVLLLLQRIVDDVRPDALVCVLCAHNDVGDLPRNKLFSLDERGQLVRNRPRLGARVHDEFQGRVTRASAPGLVRLWYYWQFADARRPVHRLPDTTIDLYLTALASQANEFFVRRNDEVVTLFEDVYDADLVLTPDAEMVRTKLALFTEIVRGIVGVARERGVPLQFVVVPSAVDACPGFGIQVDPERHPGYEADRLTATVVGAVRAAGGAVFDLTPALHAEDGRYWVGGTDIHWNSGGQAVAAGAVAELLGTREDMRRALALD